MLGGSALPPALGGRSDATFSGATWSGATFFGTAVAETAVSGAGATSGTAFSGAVPVCIQLMVGESALVQLRPLLVQPRVGPGPLRFLLGNARTALCLFGGSIPRLGFCPMACDGLLPAPLEFTSLGSFASLGTRPRKQERKRDHEQHHDDDGNDDASRHDTSLGFVTYPSPDSAIPVIASG